MEYPTTASRPRAEREGLRALGQFSPVLCSLSSSRRGGARRRPVQPRPRRALREAAAVARAAGHTGCAAA
eukprot:9138202-Pyramimonas_sp.AAC.1